jgi:predicted  nucleic acid-binding Zn-ribbon protein
MLSDSEGGSDIERDLDATNTQLFRIERKIQQGTDLTKRERRLLQNRKSALKCRLKKQQELDKMKKQVDKLANENRELKEKVKPH